MMALSLAIAALVVTRPAAAEELLILQVASSRASDRRARLAVALARAERALADARGHYANSRFERCMETTARVELELARALAPPAVGQEVRGLTQLKRLNQWLGLCQAVQGDGAAAGRAFGRAHRLPGPAPDPQIFPPPVLRRYRAAASTGQRCGAVVQGETWVDGRAVAGGDEVTLGEHYLVWRAGQRVAAGRILVTENCRLDAPMSGSAAGPALSAEEATDGALLQQIGRMAAVQRLLLIHDRTDALELSVFDVAAGRFVERRESALRGGQQLLAGLPSPEQAEPADAAPAKTPWYKRWWVWTLVGVGVAAAVTIPLVVAEPTRYEVVF